MNHLYKKTSAALFIAVALTGTACGQNSKVKTITIINGDTTITEKEIGDKEIEKIEKHITMVISDDKESSEKKTIRKKVVVNGEEDRDADALAYAYSIGEGDGEDVEITTDENGKETRIIIKKGEKERSGSGNKRTVINRSRNDEKMEGESINLNLNITGNAAKIEAETNSKEPLHISILDENGKQFFYETHKNGGKYSKEIKLEKGTYFLNLIQNKKSTTDKIIIK
ncbi:MAG: hypothetical protein K0S44_1423 [Bacteroidetes bacterium]|jgi:hypothetical protein|nr:hypothetical protein [Bacteroidota bacterium]